MLVFFVGEQFVPQQKMGGIFVGWQGLYPVEFCWLVGLVFGIFTTIHPEIWVTHVHPLLKVLVGDDWLLGWMKNEWQIKKPTKWNVCSAFILLMAEIPNNPRGDV